MQCSHLGVSLLHAVVIYTASQISFYLDVSLSCCLLTVDISICIFALCIGSCCSSWQTLWNTRHIHLILKLLTLLELLIESINMINATNSLGSIIAEGIFLWKVDLVHQVELLDVASYFPLLVLSFPRIRWSSWPAHLFINIWIVLRFIFLLRRE